MLVESEQDSRAIRPYYMAAGAVLQTLIVCLQRFLMLLGHKSNVALPLVFSSCGFIWLLWCWYLNLQMQESFRGKACHTAHRHTCMM